MKAIQNSGSMSQDELKQAAFEIYTTMPVVRISTISKRVGVAPEQVCAWRDENNWLNERANRRNETIAELFRATDSPQASAMRNLDLAKKLSNLLQSTMDESKSKDLTAGDFNHYAECVKKVADIQDRAYTRLKVK